MCESGAAPFASKGAGVEFSLLLNLYVGCPMFVPSLKGERGAFDVVFISNSAFGFVLDFVGGPHVVVTCGVFEVGFDFDSILVSTPYSYLSATSGSTLIALRAGI
jgi:hypothetical protein